MSCRIKREKAKREASWVELEQKFQANEKVMALFLAVFVVVSPLIIMAQWRSCRGPVQVIVPSNS